MTELIALAVLGLLTIFVSLIALTGWRSPEVRSFARLVRAFHGAGATWRQAIRLPFAIPAAMVGERGSTWIQDLANNVVSGLCLRIAAYTSTNTGTAIDMVNAEGNCFAVVLGGTITDGTHTPSVNEADTSGGQYSAITPMQSLVAVTSNSVQIAGFKRTKRFIKGYDTIAGATTGGVVGILVIGMKKSN